MLQHARCVQHAGRTFWCGTLLDQPVVLALSRIGKVAAATTAAALIERFAVRAVVFTGVAGGVGDGVEIGDLVLGTHFVQHDMDASPLFARYEVPLSGRTLFGADAQWTQSLRKACEAARAGVQYLGRGVQVHQGLIASGDQFVHTAPALAGLMQGLLAQGHQPLAVEMECAAVAQTCADYGVPFAAMRTISDRADASAPTDFLAFVESIASRYARDCLSQLLRSL